MKVIMTAAQIQATTEANEEANTLLCEHIDIAFNITGEPMTAGGLDGFIFHGVKIHQVAAFVELGKHYGQQHIVVVRDDNTATSVNTGLGGEYPAVTNIGNYQRVDAKYVAGLLHTLRTREGKYYAACTAEDIANAKRAAIELTTAAELEANIYGRFN